MRDRIILCVLLSVLFAGTAVAEVPQTMTYQAVLRDTTGGAADGQHEMTFRIYDVASGGTTLWQETQTVTVTDGLFDVVLGSITAIDVAFDVPYWLGIEVETNGEMTPRTEFTSVPYSLRAAVADSIVGGGSGGDDGDWTVSGNDMYSTVSGRVGIGTTSPDQKLHVNGPIWSSAGSHAGFSGGEGLRMYYYDDPGTGTLDAGHIFTYNSSDGTGRDLVLQRKGGKVGIGEAFLSAAPGADLEVRSGAATIRATNPTFSDRWIQMAYHGSIGPLLQGETYQRLTIDADAGDAGSIVLGRDGDNVGIGIIDPMYPLDVVGTANITGFRMPTGATTGYVLTSNASGVGTWQASSGGGGIGGSGTTNYLSKFTGSTTLGNSVLYETSSNIGVGKTNPSYKLDVNGTTAMTGFRLSTGASNGRVLTSNASGVGTWQAPSGFTGSGTTNYIPKFTGSSSLGNSVIYVNTGGQVGVGTTTPATRLDVQAGADWGIRSTSTGTYSVLAENPSTGTGNHYAVYGQANQGSNGYGGYFHGSDTGVEAAGSLYAGYFIGNVHVTGTLSESSGSFKIDHPLDPANKTLSHSFVESPDMMNVYNGNVLLDDQGKATVELPEWLETLNRDFRYQLTCIGGFAPVYVAEKISGNRFAIAGGEPGLEISWQVTGIRKDPYAEKNRIKVEQPKAEMDRGKYLNPEAYGLPPSMSIRSSHLLRDGDSE